MKQSKKVAPALQDFFQVYPAVLIILLNGKTFKPLALIIMNRNQIEGD
jgi:hypothetical protein